MAAESHNPDLPEVIDRARDQTDELQEYNHTLQVLGYGVIDPNRLKDEYQKLVPKDKEQAVEMLENQSSDVADHWIDTHETVERELLYFFPKYETGFHEVVMGNKQAHELEDAFGIPADIQSYHDAVGSVLQIHHDYRILEQMIENVSYSMEDEGYTSPREIRIEEDRWYSDHLERLEELEIMKASEI